jgi:3-dehydroquinate synthetase
VTGAIILQGPPSLQRCLEVRFGNIHYDFCISKGSASWDDLRGRLAELDTDLFVLIVDRSLPAAVIAGVEAQVKAIAPTLVLGTVAQEQAKRLATIDELAERAISGGVTRQSCVIALGGGIVGNMAGLLAGLLYRGIRLIHMPTTLLSMSDSVLSMKQGVNSQRGKNLLGLFHPPVFVWNQLDFLDTLPAEAIRSALCETVKNVITICPERFDQVARKLRPDGRYSAEVLTEFIELCVDSKMRVMRDDPREKGEARILEYGHTVGHAVELASAGKLHHGFAIGLGMLAAARISNLLGYLESSDAALHQDLLFRNGAPTTLGGILGIEEILGGVRLDNKRGYLRPRRGMCDFILLDGLGKPHRDEGGSLMTQVDEEVVRAGIESILKH